MRIFRQKSILDWGDATTAEMNDGNNPKNNGYNDWWDATKELK